MIKYALHPQIICSSIDGRVNYIGYMELIKLYNLDHNECVLWSIDRPESTNGLNFNDYIHLYPRTDGDYKL